MRLDPLPERFAETRDALHQIAFFALAPARYTEVGRMGLQAAPGGFGTPRFGGRIARVEGDSIIFEESEKIASQTITTVRTAADFVGTEYQTDWFEDFHDPLTPVDPDTVLNVDDTAARALGQWFNFAFDVLEELRAAHRAQEDDTSQIQLWPEHFDAAIEIGSDEKGQRASYGVSPGDSAHRDPYVYVAPWVEVDTANPYWNDGSFNGSSLGYSELVEATDATKTALHFLLEGYRILHSS